jgi:hypothetical protein
VTNGNSHDHSGGDGGQIAYASLSGLPTLGTAAALNAAYDTFTPVLQGSTTPGTYTYTTRTGYRYKIGRLCFVHFALTVNAVTSAGTGSAQIAGLPEAASNVSGLDPVGSLQMSGVSGFSSTWWVLRIQGGTSVVMPMGSAVDSAGGNLAVSGVGAGDTLRGTIIYLID